jgi:hypothetical protein
MTFCIVRVVQQQTPKAVIDPALAARLLELRERSQYCEAEDWVFANEAGRPP